MPDNDSPVPRYGIYAEAREDWLALHVEDIIDPDRPIIDPHLHLWDRAGDRYMLDQVTSDIGSGHNIVATVYVECHSMYRAHGPEQFRAVGEVEFAAGIAAMSASGGYGPAQACAAIVGNADLTLGEDVRPVLEAEIAAAGGRFRGIRHSSARSEDPHIAKIYPNSPANLLADTKFREGFACLDAMGLSFDAWMFHPQLDELTDIAHAFPDTSIILNHCGGPIGIGGYADRSDEVFREWKNSIERLSAAPNVHVKLGGLAIRLLGHRFEDRDAPASSEELAEAWGPWINTCIEAFGADRCMFESNFPPDKGQCSYRTLFNVFKRLAAPYSEAEKTALFSGTAAKLYKLDID